MLPHVLLAITNKSSTFEVRGRVECPYYRCFNKVPFYLWLNFELKREQEIAVESMFSNSLIIHALMTQSDCFNSVRCMDLNTQ